MPKSKIYEFVILRNDEIITYERTTIKGAMMTLEDFQSQYPSRTYELYKKVNGDDY